MIAAAEVDNLVKDIIAILQPLKVAVSKAKAEKMARSYIGKIDQLHRGDAGISPGAARTKYAKFSLAMAKAIRAYQALPLGSRADLMAHAWPSEVYMSSNEDFCASSNTLLPYMQRLAAIAGSPEFATKDGAFVKYRQTRERAVKTAAAGYAHKLITEASMKQPTTTMDGPYEQIARFMHRAVTGIDISMREWCAKERKRQREHQKIIRSIEGRDP
jgi:hypothetical protein